MTSFTRPIFPFVVGCSRSGTTLLRALGAWLQLPYDPAMLERRPLAVPYPEHHRRLELAPTPGLRDWRREMSVADAARFQAVAGDALAELGY